MRKLTLALALLPLIACPFTAGAVVYKWVDAEGKVHFSDRPQGDAQAVELKVPPYPRTQRGGDDPPPADTARPPDDGGQRPDPARARQAIREKNCEIARQALERNRNIGRMYRIGADGERHYLSAEERDMVLQRSREDVGKWCD